MFTVEFLRLLQKLGTKQSIENKVKRWIISVSIATEISLSCYDRLFALINRHSVLSFQFCISSLFALLLRAEQIYATTSDPDIASNKEWPQFLSTLSASLSRTVQHQTISAAIESDAIQPMVHHFSRFETLKLESLLALFSQAKQQVN